MIGILLERYCEGVPWAVVGAISLSFILLIVYFFLRLSYHKVWLRGLLLFGSFVFLSFGWSRWMKVVPVEPADKVCLWKAEILEVPKQTTAAYRTFVEVTALKEEGNWNKWQHRLLLYMDSSLAVEHFLPGDQIVAYGRIRAVRPPLNPAAFNYKAYLADRGVHYQCRLKHAPLIIASESGIKREAARLQQLFVQILEEAELGEDEMAVATALVLGEKHFLERELRDAYAGAGAMHVLAVSGLHVGILFLLLQRLFFFLHSTLWFKWLKTLLIIILLWAYALVCGLPPSVQRACLMFSFVIVGQSMNRPLNFFNTLAASALLILLMDPQLLFGVSFQLSYAAVSGIVLIYPRLYPLLTPKWWLMDKIWSLCIVSIAAQLATFPFALYYFHQFPNYFLLSNLLVIPLVSIILPTAILVLLITLFFGKWSLLILLFKYLLVALNTGVRLLYELPFSVSNHIWLHEALIVLLIIACISLIILFYYPKYHSLKWVGITINLFVAALLFQAILRKNQRRLTIYQLYGETAISMVHGSSAVVLSSISKTDKKWHPIGQHLASLGIREQQCVLIGDSTIQFTNNHLMIRKQRHLYFQFEKQRFLIPMDKDMPNDSTFDCIILTEHFKGKIEALGHSKVQHIIDGSVPFYRLKQMDDATFYWTAREGAFMWNP